MPALALALVLLVASPTAAATIVLDFEEETPGGTHDPLLSAECGCVVFSGYPLGAGLRIHDFDGDRILSPGRDLEGGSLVIEFVGIEVTALSLAFGGDSGAPTVEDFPAVLTGYVGEDAVAMDTVAANRNLLIDQTLSVASAVPFTRVVFDFVQLGEFEPLSAHVGTVTLETVPEPTAGLLALAGCLAALAAHRKRGASVLGAPGCVLALLLASPAGASTITLDFEEEALALYRGTAFTSAECGCVELSEADGGYLVVVDFFGSRVIVVGEEGGALRLDFLVPVTALSLDFGGDEAGAADGPAQLFGFTGGQEVAYAELEANGNRLVDQTLSIDVGVALESALFVFPQSGEFEPISPLVDNLVLTVLDVPEPSAALTLGALALAGLACGRRRTAPNAR